MNFLFWFFIGIAIGVVLGHFLERKERTQNHKDLVEMGQAVYDLAVQNQKLRQLLDSGDWWKGN